MRYGVIGESLEADFVIKKPTKTITITLLILILMLSACDALIGEPVLEIPGLASTLAVQTLMANEQMAELLNTPTPSPYQKELSTTVVKETEERVEETPVFTDISTTILPPTSTMLPTLTPEGMADLFAPEVTPIDPDAPCNAADFIRDVTIPDDTVVKPNSKFTKTWAIRNIGSCVWKKGEYALVLYWGHKMGTEPPIPLQFDVVPGQTAELSVDMVAPTIPSCWQGNWMLQDGEGNRFGIGPNYKNYFWVSVTVWWPDIPNVIGG